MPFMKGREPVRRTLNYLNAGTLVLKDKIKIFSINYNTYGRHHEGEKIFRVFRLKLIFYSLIIRSKSICVLENSPAAIQKSKRADCDSQEHDTIAFYQMLLWLVFCAMLKFSKTLISLLQLL